MKDSVKGVLDEMLLSHPELIVCKEDILGAWEILYKCFYSHKAVLICGNGGSAGDSEHIVGELMKNFQLKRKLPKVDRVRLENTLKKEVPGVVRDEQALINRLQGALPAISLVSQTSLITSISNDIDGEMIFAQQVYGYRKIAGALIGITTSGSSVNVVNALKTAKAFGIPTLALTGQSGGILRDVCDIAIRVPAAKVDKVQELHLPVYHTLCSMIEEAFFGDS